MIIFDLTLKFEIFLLIIAGHFRAALATFSNFVVSSKCFCFKTLIYMPETNVPSKAK